MKMVGTMGEVRYGYQLAARLGAWEVTPESQNTMRLRADLQECDAYWSTQSPLSVALAVGRKRWVWEVGSVELAGGIARAQLVGRPAIVD